MIASASGRTPLFSIVHQGNQSAASQMIILYNHVFLKDAIIGGAAL